MARRRRDPGPPSDRALGLRTRGTVEVDDLGLVGPSAAHAERYEPTPEGVLEDMLLDLDVEPDDATFTDLGCGRGAVVCRAALRPFRAVLGVELSEGLARDAQRNVARLREGGHVRARDVRVEHGDAARHRFTPGPQTGSRVVYLYNPFRPPVLRAVLRNLIAAQAQDGLPTRILYFEPLHDAVLTARPEVNRLRVQPRWASYAVRGSGVNTPC